jgi:hypothetical protein
MTDRFAYPLPFGAEVQADGQTRFRLWAPDLEEVGLRLDSGAEHAMHEESGGWFSLVTEAAPGTGYQYRVTGDLLVPDPASRGQADDVHGASLVIDPRAYQWQHPDWSGRPWEEAVVTELHVGTATPDGTFDALRRRLDHFVDTGITAIEIMPVADFSGSRGWGYDGVLLYAPERSYGTPDKLKRLIDEAHGRGIMVLLDVVYNHFGPDGNYLHAYASQHSSTRAGTPRGAPASTSAAARCVTSSSTTSTTGWKSTASTACASTPSTRSRTAPTSICWPRSPARRAPACPTATSISFSRTTTTPHTCSRASQRDVHACTPPSGTTTTTTSPMCC